MTRRPAVPEELTFRPFTLAQAAAAGLSRTQLESGGWRRVGPGMYAWAGLPVRELMRLEAAICRLPRGSAFSGPSGAWLHEMDSQSPPGVEATVVPGAGVSGRVGIRIVRARLEPGEIVTRYGLPVTSLLRTVADLARRPPMGAAVALIDLAVRSGRIELDALDAWARRHPGDRGVARLRRAIELADPVSESPMESRLRVILVEAGLPKPELQVPLEDAAGTFLGRADLFFRDARLCVEYDGGTHRESLAEDNRRQNRLVNAGYTLLRFTAADLGTPDAVVAQVRRALSAGIHVIRRPA